MKALKVLFATVVAIALSTSVTAYAAGRANSNKSQTQSRSSQWRELTPDQKNQAVRDELTKEQSAKDVDDNAAEWRGSAAARDRMNDQDEQATVRNVPGRSATGLRELDQVGSARIFFFKLGPADIRMSKLAGLEVRNLQDEDIGEIKDVILDNNKNMRAIVIGLNGKNERDIAVDPTSLVLAQDKNGNVEAFLNTTREDLRDAPEFRFDERRRNVSSY